LADPITIYDVIEVTCGNVPNTSVWKYLEVAKFATSTRNRYSILSGTLWHSLSLFANGHASINVGGGIVYDSTAVSDYEEALWKTRYMKLHR
jgi:hypothetical protein